MEQTSLPRTYTYKKKYTYTQYYTIKTFRHARIHYQHYTIRSALSSELDTEIQSMELERQDTSTQTKDTT